MERRKPLKRNKGLARSKGGLKRSPKPLHVALPSPIPLEELPRKLWGEAVRTMRCAMCGGRSRVQGHHVVPKRWLKSESLHDLLWDTRNRMPLCHRCHERHENASQRVTRDRLRPQHLDFMREVGLLEGEDFTTWPDWLANAYPEPPTAAQLAD